MKANKLFLPLLLISLSLSSCSSISTQREQYEGDILIDEKQSTSDKEELFANLFDSASICFDNLYLTLDGLGDKPLSLHASNLAVNYIEAYEGNHPISRLSGAFDLQYDTVQGSFLLSVDEERVSVHYDNQIYYCHMDTLGDIFYILSSLPTFSTSAMANEDLLSTVNDILGEVENSVETAIEKKIEDSYQFDFTTKYGNVVLESDSHFDLTSINTPTPLVMEREGKEPLSLSLDGDAKVSHVSSLATSILETQNDINLDGLDPFLLTLVNMAKEKKFDVAVDVSIRGEDFVEGNKKVGFDISADLSEDTPFVQASLSEERSDYVKGSALVTYDNERIYVNVNEGIKGFIDQANISDLISTLGKETSTVEATTALEKVGSFFDSDTSIYKILHGDYSVYGDFITAIHANEDGTELVISLSSKAFGLTSEEKEMQVKISFVDQEKIQIQKIEVLSLPIANDVIDITLTLQDLTAEKRIAIDKENYGNYNGILPVVSEIYPYLDSKKGSFDFSVDIYEKDNDVNTSFMGEATLDLSQVSSKEDLTSLEFAASVSTVVNNHNHYIDIRRIGDNNYLSLDHILKEYVSSDETGAIYHAILDGMEAWKGSDALDTSDFTGALDSLSSLFTIAGGIDLDSITNLISTDNVLCSDDKFVAILNTASLSLDSHFGTIAIAFDTSGEFLSLDVSGFSYKNLTISLTLNLKDYVSPLDMSYMGGDFDLSSFDGKEVKDLNIFITGLFDILSSSLQYQVDLDMRIEDLENASKYIDIDGKVQFDYPNSMYMGSIVIDIDRNSYDPILDFVHNNPSYNGMDMSNKTYAMYRSKNSSNYLGLEMGSATIGEALSSLLHIQESNLLYQYLQPILEILRLANTGDVKVEDYTKFFDDYMESILLSTPNQISLSIYNHAIGLKGDGAFTLTVHYDENNGITGADISNLGLTSTKILSGSITLNDYDPDYKPSTLFTSSFSYINFDFLPLMVDLTLNTTENTDFNITGNLEVDLPILSDVTADLQASIHVVPGDKNKKADVTAYIKITPTDGEGTYTQFFIRPQDEDCLIYKHYSNSNNVILHVSASELLKHFGYYILGMALNFEKEESLLKGVGAVKNYAVAQIEGAINSSATSEEKEDKGGIMGTAIYPEKLIKTMAYNEGNKTFHLGVDLSSIDLGIAIISLGNDVSVDITHTDNSENQGELKSIAISGQVLEIIGIITIDLTLNASVISTSIEFQDMMDKVENKYFSTYSESDFYEISKVEQTYKNKTWIFETGSKLAVSDNGKKITTSSLY